MLPEMLFYDPSRQAHFPVNGRTLTDDAVDSFLALLTKWEGEARWGRASPGSTSEFPYLGPPHNPER